MEDNPNVRKKIIEEYNALVEKLNQEKETNESKSIKKIYKKITTKEKYK
jgi:hypothetical protein